MRKPPLNLKKMISELEDKPKPNLEKADIINVGTVENPRELKIGHQLIQEHKYELSQFLKEYQDVFAWSYQDMPGLAPDIVTHKFAIKLNSRRSSKNCRS